MGYDTVSIVSMNSAREGLHSLPREARGSYLSQLLNGLHPDIGVLPGDNPELKNNFLVGYGQYTTQTQNTLLLYDANKVEMKKQCVSENIFNELWGLDPTQLAWPEVEVSTLEPYKTVVKRFTLIAIPHTMFQVEQVTVTDREQLLDRLVILAQRLAIVTGNPLLIAGDIRLPMQAVRQIVSQRNNATQHDFLTDQHDKLKQLGFLPSMVKGASRDHRHTFKMEPVQCKRNEVVQTWKPEQAADCFIASKCLEMSEAKGIKVEEALGRQVKMAAIKKSHVTKTEMQIPVRPPKHHGG